MIVPNKNYSVTTEFDRSSNRWKARFNSEKPEGISFAFPLPDDDVSTDGAARRLGSYEERLLALVFQQMVTTALEQMAQRQLSAPSASESGQLLSE